MPSLGPFEISIILVVVLILFGPGKLPQVFGALGNGVRQFKKASQGLTDEVNTAIAEPVTPAASTKAEPATSQTTSEEKPASPTATAS